jgi:hypothetical protein
MDRSTFDARKR